MLEKVLQIAFGTPDTTDQYDRDEIGLYMPMAIIAYLSWLLILPLFLMRGSKYVRYHCNQGLVLAIPATVIIIILSLLSKIPFIGILFFIIMVLFIIAYILVSAIGIANCVMGKAREIPYIGGVRILKDIVENEDEDENNEENDQKAEGNGIAAKVQETINKVLKR